MTLPFEAYNVIPPYRNSTGLASQAAVVVNQAGVNINLSDYFGALGAGHFFTFQADGAKIYVQLCANSGGVAANEQDQGSGAGVAWPIPDGQQLPMRFLGGREQAATGGYATLVNYASGIIVRAKLPLSGAATGFLRIYRSSVGETQGLEQLKPPGLY